MVREKEWILLTHLWFRNSTLCLIFIIPTGLCLCYVFGLEFRILFEVCITKINCSHSYCDTGHGLYAYHPTFLVVLTCTQMFTGVSIAPGHQQLTFTEKTLCMLFTITILSYYVLLQIQYQFVCESILKAYEGLLAYSSLEKCYIMSFSQMIM